MSTFPKLLNARVLHKRMRPKIHQFAYSVFYLAVPLSKVRSLDDGWLFGVNRRALMQFRTGDFGPRVQSRSKNAGALIQWVKSRLRQEGIDLENPSTVDEIVLVTMPRILGYLFNPVSFYFCYTEDEHLVAVLAEVNNTFGETHSYICVRPDQKPIGSADWLEAEKQFHVSPFYHRDGSYRFRFEPSDERLAIQIDYQGDDGADNLLTSVSGRLETFNRKNLMRAFWRHPLQTLMVTGRIHWHVLRLWRKGMQYIAKPRQYAQRLGKTTQLHSSPSITRIETVQSSSDPGAANINRDTDFVAQRSFNQSQVG